MRDPDTFVDAHYTDRYGHTIVPGSWVHLILSGSDHMSVCQALRYERRGASWACVVAAQNGEDIDLFGRQCSQCVVRLVDPICPASSEWAAVERSLLDQPDPPSTVRPALSLAALLRRPIGELLDDDPPPPRSVTRLDLLAV